MPEEYYTKKYLPSPKENFVLRSHLTRTSLVNFTGKNLLKIFLPPPVTKDSSGYAADYEFPNIYETVENHT